jgi:hypothetical protein
MRSGLVSWRSADTMLCLPMWTALLADAALRVGQLQGLDAELADARRLARTNGEMLAFPELLRLREPQRAIGKPPRNSCERRSRSPLRRAHACSSFALFAISPDFGPSEANAGKPPNCLRRSTARLLKAMTRPTCEKPGC